MAPIQSGLLFNEAARVLGSAAISQDFSQDSPQYSISFLRSLYTRPDLAFCGNNRCYGGKVPNMNRLSFTSSVPAAALTASGVVQETPTNAGGSDKDRKDSPVNLEGLPAVTPFESPIKQYLKNRWTAAQLLVGMDPLSRKKRQKLVLLGTGWATMAILPKIDVTKYEVIVISPRNYFTFTPLLPSVCAGTLSPRSCMEPVRRFLRRGQTKVMDFYEASATEVDPAAQEVHCKNKSGAEFSVKYDYLVIAVGAETNTFNIPGADKYSCFLKELENAREIHRKVIDNFEKAIVPGTSEEDKKRLLHFVVVGGGPTGVETAAELCDFIHEDLVRHFPQLKDYVKVSLIEMLPRLLPMFEKDVSDFTLANLGKIHVETLLQSRVTNISAKTISIEKTVPQSSGGTSKVNEEIPYGFVVWASGVGQTPLAKSLLQSVKEQKNNRVLNVDERLRMIGSENIYCIGDCAVVKPRQLATPHVADQLYEEATHHPSGPGSEFLESKAAALSLVFPQISKGKWDFNQKPKKSGLSKNEFCEYLKEIDSNYKSPAATAQFATQEGIYLAKVLNQFVSKDEKAKAPAFVEVWKGYLAYVGGGQAVAHLPMTTLLGGIHTNLLWKFVYFDLQLSYRNKMIMLADWTRGLVGGRDVGRDHTSDGTLELYKDR